MNEIIEKLDAEIAKAERAIAPLREYEAKLIRLRAAKHAIASGVDAPRANRKPGTARAIVLQLLRENGPMRFTDICTKSGLVSGNLGMTISRLIAAGSIVRLSRGVYALAPDPTTETAQ